MAKKKSAIARAKKKSAPKNKLASRPKKKPAARAKKKAVRSAKAPRALKRSRRDKPARGPVTKSGNGAARQDLPNNSRVKITVEKHQHGTALSAVRGDTVTIGPNLQLMKYGGTTLYWTRTAWSEELAQTAVLITKHDITLELERAKRALPFGIDVSGIIVEWNVFLI